MNKDQKTFHKSRRNEFSKLIGADSIAIVFGNTHRNKSYDGDYKFKQYKNFYYLTGFQEPESAVLLAPGGIEIQDNGNKKTVNEILYVQEKDKLKETWSGRRLGFENVKEELGIENSFINEELRKVLNPLALRKFRRLYINFAEMLKLTNEMKRIVTFFMESLNRIAPHVEITDASYLLGKMRAVKTGFEINNIKKASEISTASYYETLASIRPGENEFGVQAVLEYYYKYYGGEETAYPPIVASGENACILHYEENNKELKNGELLLIDSASEYNYYCSDITRTFPINGKFTKEQRIIYDIVLKANKECIKFIKPGVKYSELDEVSSKVLAEGLYKAGILKNKKDIKKYSLHGIGHHIGLDTHDAVPFNKTRTSDSDTLKPGNVLTIEPGLYFTGNMKEIPAGFRGIGVRIEDVILVTKDGNQNLTENMVKDAEDIENIMSLALIEEGF